MFDKRVILDPRCFHFHSNYPRNYNSKTKEEGLTIDIKGDPYKLVGQDNQIRNALICGYTLGGEKWLNLMRDSWLERVASRYVVNGIVEDARRVAEEERKWLEANAKYTLDEVLINARRNKIPGLEVWEPRISEDPLK
jgi:hypothetical protein